MAGTNIGNAYITIMPSTKGFAGKLSSEMSGVGSSAGSLFGGKFVTALKGVIAAAGIVTFFKKAIDAGGELQQSFGGLDTIYGDAADAAKKLAYEASKAGISANDYAEQAVSFGAALRMAYGGDTTKAVEAANMAIMDMNDNWAKMGTPLENIQNALTYDRAA